MATYLWGTPGSWTDAIAAANLSALANNALVVGSNIDNSTTLVQQAEVSFISTAAAITTTAGAHLAVYLLPLLHDGTSYPTNSATSTTLLPAVGFVSGIISMPVGSVVPAGSCMIAVRPGQWKFGLVNRLGVALNTSTTALTLKYRLITETVA